MIDQHALESMKPGSVLINVARGPVVVERDLVNALESGHVGGAGLDVTEIEPLPNSRLWDLPNVIITPHVGAQSKRRIDDATDLFCDNLQRFREGRPLAKPDRQTARIPARGERGMRGAICDL